MGHLIPLKGIGLPAMVGALGVRYNPPSTTPADKDRHFQALRGVSCRSCASSEFLCTLAHLEGASMEENSTFGERE